MPMPSLHRTFIVVLSSALALINSGCSQMTALWQPNESSKPIAVSSTPSPTAQPSVNPEVTPTPRSQPKINPQEAYQQALDAAESATLIAQSAQSADDWQLAIARWQEAIDLLKVIPSSNPNYASAQSKIGEYQSRLNTAKQQAARFRPPSDAQITIATGTVNQPGNSALIDSNNTLKSGTESESDSTKATVFKAPIKRRVGKTPVIDVTFNGEQTFEMIVDTGASGTVITQAMAQKLGVVAEGEITANTASEKDVKFAVAKVKSIAVGGAVKPDFQLAIGGSDLDLGLLGQDFFSNYDVVIRQNVVEFHSR